MRPWSELIALMMIAIVLSGCLSDEPDVDDAPLVVQDDTPAPPPGVVVADVSAGTNVYHETFRRPGWTHHPSEAIPGFPADAPALHLTFGDDYAANLAADEAVWAGYEEGRIHWVPGTNILLWTIDPYSSTPSGHGHAFHGSATAGAVNDGCPECYILVVQDWDNANGGALEALSTLPWVDFVTSTVFHGPAGIPYGHTAHSRGSRMVHDNGSLYFAPSGNQVVNGMLLYVWTKDWAWPPWVVNVGGGHERCGSGELTSGQYPEFVNDYVQFLPSAEVVEGTQPTAGTSFATPLSAGRFGHALWLVRQELGYGDGGRWSGEPGPGFGLEDGVLTAEEMRAAFARAAVYFDATDYQLPGPCLVANAPVPVAPGPWVQQGWGHIASGTSQVVADAILGRVDLPEKDAAATAWMDAVMTARETTTDLL